MTLSKRPKPPTKGRAQPATMNRTTKHAAIVSSFGDEAIYALQVQRMMTITSLINQKRKDKSVHPEIRGFDEQAGAFLCDTTGLPKRKCYSQPEHVKVILELYKTIPAQFQPRKWAVILSTI